MSEIERHWLADIPGYSGPFVVEDSEEDLARYKAELWRLHGPYVPADQLTGAVEALRLLWDDIRETDKRFIPSDVRAKVDAALAGRSTHRTEETG